LQSTMKSKMRSPVDLRMGLFAFPEEKDAKKPSILVIGGMNLKAHNVKYN
jgi:hypothetical protein